MRGTKLCAMLAAMFMAGAFLASPELRAYAANTVFSTDIKDGEVKTADLANNAVTSAKVKDGEVKTEDIAPSAIGSLRIKDNDVKAQDIAPDAVGASEIIGVSKLIFAECTISSGLTFSHGSAFNFICPVQGAASGDNAIAERNLLGCWGVNAAEAGADFIRVGITNNCFTSSTIGTIPISIIVYNK